MATFNTSKLVYLFRASRIYAILFCLVLCIGYFMSFDEQTVFLFTVLPGNVLPPNFWIWTSLSHSFVEFHWWIVLWDFAAIHVYSRLLGPSWGKCETVTFYAIVTFLVAFLTTFTYIGVYLLTQETDYIFDYYVNGLAGYVAAISVAIKQTMPNYVIVNTSYGKLQTSHLPLLLQILTICFAMFSIVENPYPLMFMWGLFVSWVYLRFYQKHRNGVRGDTNDNFSFASFFPSGCKPIVIVLSNAIFSLLVKIRLCHWSQDKHFAIQSATIVVNLPGFEVQTTKGQRLPEKKEERMKSHNREGEISSLTGPIQNSDKKTTLLSTLLGTSEKALTVEIK